MGKKKLIRFSENVTFPHLFQYSYEDLKKGFPFKGNWNSDFFGNDHPIALELGCGKGEYTIFLSKKYPERNYIGIDIKGARLWRGCKTVQEDQIRNVAFIRSRIQLLSSFFAEKEISEIWITFPDPQPRHTKESKRLTSPEFLDMYRKVLKDESIIHLKTDNAGLYAFTLEVIERDGHLLIYKNDDIYGTGYGGDAASIRTFYEEKFLEQGIPIKYIQFQLSHE